MSLQPALRPPGMFVLRTALLAFDELVAWSDGLEAPQAPAAQRADALARDRERLRERLRVLIARPEVREALFVASPSLEAHLDDWRDAPGGARGRKVERALVRYVQRMAGRATPFGLFGGCTLGEIDPAATSTALALAPRSAYRRHTRLDMDYVVALTTALAADPELRARLVYRPNASLYRAAGQLRYMETRGDRDGRAYGMVAVEPSEYLDAVLARCRAGARPTVLAGALVERDPDIDAEDAAAFVDTLIERQILVPELAPALTGPEPVPGLVAALDRMSGQTAGAGAAACVLAGAQAELAALDANGLGADPARYRAVAQALAALPAQPELARLFQVDMIKPAEAARLGAVIAAEVGRGVEILRSITPPRRDELATFRERFQARYERREVPLAQVLDQESGIGLGDGRVVEASPLLAGLEFGGAGMPTSMWDDRYGLLQRKLVAAAGAGARPGPESRPEIILDDADLRALARPDALPLPPGLAAIAVLAASSAASSGSALDEVLARGAFRVYLRGFRGPSGADILARFCHADAGLDAAVHALVAAEEASAPDAVHAEIVHLPEGRVGNVLLRPLLRGYEIPYLGRSAAAPDRQIGIEDLLVSVTGSRVVLRSRRLDREIWPRLTTAHAVRDGLPVYRFLSAVARQGMASGLGWDWGPLACSPFLPRVITGRLVLDLARWRLAAPELANLARASDDTLFDAVQALRAQRGLPRRVALVDADNLLPVDLDNVLSIEAFAQLIRGRHEAELVELFPDPGELCVHGPEGRFVHELVVPFLYAPAGGPTLPEPKPEPRRERASAPAVVRRFAPGSEWLYVKLYGGPATADRVLRGLIAPLLAESLASGAVDRWFFLRYGDPELHLRVRLHGPAERITGEVLPRLHQATQPWLADQRLWRLVLDTYEREVERYGGGDGMVLAEEIFAADSDAALALVSRLAGDAGLDVRWRITLWGMDRLLRDLGLDLAARQHVIARARAALGRRLGVDASLERALGARYRQERLALEDLVAPALPAEHPLAGAAEIFAERSQRVVASAAALRRANAEGRLSAAMTALAGDFVHLHANRMLRGVSSRQELVIYDLLGRLYQSRQARGLLE